MDNFLEQSIKAHTSMPSTIAMLLEETGLSRCQSLSSGNNCWESVCGCDVVAVVCPSTAVESLTGGWSQSVYIFQWTEGEHSPCLWTCISISPVALDQECVCVLPTCFYLHSHLHHNISLPQILSILHCFAGNSEGHKTRLSNSKPNHKAILLSLQQVCVSSRSSRLFHNQSVISQQLTPVPIKLLALLPLAAPPTLSCS